MARGQSLVAYALMRVLIAIPMLFILLTVIFVVLRVMPGDPILALWGGRAPPQSAIDSARQQLGLDQPYIVQYWIYLTGVFTGNLGISIGELYRGQPVWHQIYLRLPATIELAIGSMLVASTVGILLGVLAGTRRDKASDVGIRLFGTIIWVIPVFWLGIMMQLVFAVWLGWLPPHGRWSGTDYPARVTGLYTIDSLLEGSLPKFFKALSFLVLPCVTLGLILSGFFTKAVRANMLRTVNADYTEAARARGVSERKVVFRHAFRNALVPVVTILGLTFAILFAGAVLTERTFSIEGIGLLLLNSITTKDMTMIQGVVVVYAAIIIAISVAVDIIGARIDPRIRL